MIIECNRIWQYQDSDSGLILPWYTLPCLEWLKSQETSQWYVFEYGAGYSTIWWRANCKIVNSIDSNARWAKAIGVFDFEGSSDSHYAGASETGTKELHDCIIVDGILREKCVESAIHNLKSGGYLIIDNWQSEDYNPELNKELLKDWPIQLFKQPNHSQWITAVLIKP